MLHRRVATFTALALAACSPEKSITVSGTVVSTTGGPISGAQVYVASRAPVITGADGRFEVRSVATPYEIVAIERDADRPYVSIYEGLTTPNPRVAIRTFVPRITANANVSGTLAGYGAQPGHITRVTACAPYPLFQGTSLSAPGGLLGADFEEVLGWDSGPSTSLKMYALSFAPDGTGLPASYDGLWSSDTVDVSDGANVSAVSLAAAAILSGHVTVSYDGLPAGYDVAFALPMDRSGGCALLLPVVNTPPTSFSYLAPDANSPGFVVAVVARNAAAAEITGFVEFALQLGVRAKGVHFHPGVTLLSPEPLGSVPPSGSLRWSSPAANPLSVVSVQADGTAPWVTIVTNGTTANLAWLQRAGMTMPSATTYNWWVETFEVGTVDDYAQLPSVGHMSDVTRPHLLASGVVARSGVARSRRSEALAAGFDVDVLACPECGNGYTSSPSSPSRRWRVGYSTTSASRGHRATAPKEPWLLDDAVCPSYPRPSNPSTRLTPGGYGVLVRGDRCMYRSAK